MTLFRFVRSCALFVLLPALVAAADHPVKIVLVGDSTVTDRAGWGLGFAQFVGPDAVCINTSRGGRSSKSFIQEGAWKQALALKGDYYLIQFGHNDEPGKGPDRETTPATTYTQFMAQYVDEARAIGAQPILVTSLTRRKFSAKDDHALEPSLVPYAEAVRKLAAAKHVPLVDLNARSAELCAKLGKDGCAPLSASLPGGGVDTTHLNARGSVVFAQLVVDELHQVAPELAHVLLPAPKSDNPVPPPVTKGGVPDSSPDAPPPAPKAAKAAVRPRNTAPVAPTPTLYLLAGSASAIAPDFNPTRVHVKDAQYPDVLAQLNPEDVVVVGDVGADELDQLRDRGALPVMTERPDLAQKLSVPYFSGSNLVADLKTWRGSQLDRALSDDGRAIPPAPPAAVIRNTLADAAVRDPSQLQPFLFCGSLDEQQDSPDTLRRGKVILGLAGDSTVTYSAGYAAGLRAHLEDQLQVINLSRGGRTTVTFRTDGRWAQMLALKPDYVMIQFGHNDEGVMSVEAYADNLRRYVDEARAAKIKPILVTPISRRYWQADGKIHSDLVAFAAAMQAVAAEKGVPLMDLHGRAIAYYEQVGKAVTDTWSYPKPNAARLTSPHPETLPATVLDLTHFNPKGSAAVGGFVADELKRAVPALAPYIH